MPWIIDYFSEEVRLEIDALPVGIRASYTRLTELLEEFGLELRMPHSRAMGGALFELRPRGREGTARVFYCMKVGRKIIMLHSFIKKTNETPKRELEIARRRQREVSGS
jgi:phage-related protein